jgi:hypothetical protein
LIKQIGVALDLGQTNDLVKVDQARLGRKRLDGQYLGELVEVASRDYACLGILGEDVGNEVLQRKAL